MSDSTNPYTAPETEVVEKLKLEPQPVKGIVVGVLVDLGGTIVAGGILGIALGIIMLTQGYSEDEIDAVFENIEFGSLLFNLSTAIGLMCSFLGGYFCAKVSKANFYRQGLIMSCIVGAVGFIVGIDDYNPIITVLLYLISLAFTFTGVWFYARKHTALEDIVT